MFNNHMGIGGTLFPDKPSHVEELPHGISRDWVLNLGSLIILRGAPGSVDPIWSPHPGLYWSLFWVNYNDLTATSLGIMVSIGNHPQMALIQVSELL